MKKHILIYLSLLLVCSLLLTGCTKKENETETESNDSQEIVEEESSDSKGDDGVEEETGSSDLEGFNKEAWVLGESSEYEYSIEEILAEEGVGYHVFKFTISSSVQEATTPLFTVTPILSNGVFRVSLTNIFDDNTSVTHSKGIVVNKSGITGLTRLVTDSDTTRAYDIGVLGLNKLKVEVENNDVGTWVFLVKVSYDSKYTAPTIDFGSTEFSSEVQEIEGVTVSEGAKILDYSFIYSSGVLKFSLEVASGASNPIPSANAAYNEDGQLVLTFPSLEQDKVSGWSKTISLPAGISAEILRSGDQSIYTFNGISNTKPFKLSATQSPNLVILEIDL